MLIEYTERNLNTQYEIKVWVYSMKFKYIEWKSEYIEWNLNVLSERLYI